ncbi:hypothetical protein ACELLULO517_09280 [Acidisoma cellulosilytica]|uniref:Uncharacterized protein n=1 Tax=Acidisoma cellulosilyticum TaxID=2802395 RepID=A0A963Z097_9PROT|nr:hypothetical protein [Acidisoma cellulosilyticum]MCB8880423.1 hypothetical protein [Acidisoma cellulosilyticum]
MATQANYSWKPSAARLLTIAGFEPRPRGTIPTGRANAWPPKDPADVLDYSYDISPALWGDEGDTIAFLDVTITPGAAGDVTLNSSSADGRCAILWLGGGQSGTTYAVTLAIETLAGRGFQRTVYLPCLSLSTEPPLGLELTTETGAPILDASGNPIFIES